MATIHQRDGETIRCPILETVTPPAFYDANPATHTASLVIKTNRRGADTTPIAGTISGDLTAGYVATFTIPASLTGTAGRQWMHAWVTPPGGEPMTIAAESLTIVAT